MISRDLAPFHTAIEEKYRSYGKYITTFFIETLIIFNLLYLYFSGKYEGNPNNFQKTVFPSIFVSLLPLLGTFTILEGEILGLLKCLLLIFSITKF